MRESFISSHHKFHTILFYQKLYLIRSNTSEIIPAKPAHKSFHTYIYTCTYIYVYTIYVVVVVYMFFNTIDWENVKQKSLSILFCVSRSNMKFFITCIQTKAEKRLQI